MPKVQTLSALAKAGALSKRVFIRADLNVPFDDAGRISEDTRIRAPCPASAWYDNEWGFSNRMLDTTVALMSAKCIAVGSKGTNGFSATAESGFVPFVRQL